MKIIEKDILTVEKGIICQQVNCQGAMNSGLAKQIREKWPIVYEKYAEYNNRFKNDFELLGDFHEVDVKINEKTKAPEIIVCNIFGQLLYGYDGNRYTDYAALKIAFWNYKRLFDSGYGLEIYFPFNFGCDRGGADWNIVSKMIEYYFPNAIICKLPPK